MADKDKRLPIPSAPQPEGPGLAESIRNFERVVSLDDHREPLDPAPHQQPGKRHETIRILIVEDDEDDFVITRELLERAEAINYCVEWANGVETGLKRLAAGCFDLCIIDYRLSGSSGLDLVQIAHRRGYQMPMILVSGMAEEAVDVSALDLGVEDFIDKEEFDVGRLDRAIRFALARRKALTRYGRLAQYDDLTGLANRVMFRNRLDRALAAARRRRTKAAVMVLDLNRFKEVNDHHGHIAGDKILSVVGERLTSGLRETDTVARLGGDGFALVIEDLQKPEFAGIVARKILDSLIEPFRVENMAIPVNAALGVSIFPDDGETPEALVQLADAAMYEAKREGGNRCRFHDPTFDNRMRHGSLVANDLRRAIETNSLLLQFQPQVTLSSSKIGLSSIIQWNHHELGHVGAEHFKTLAEDSGTMEPLTDWAIGQACMFAKRWHLDGLGPLHVSVPMISRRQLSWSNLANRITSLLRSHQLPASWIELEIDESLLLEELKAGGEAFPALRATGARIAVSGFGGGGTSLVVLRDTPVNTVKLSTALLNKCPKDSHRTLFVASVISLAKRLNLRVVAEGVENQQQLKMLREQRCDAVQSVMSCPPLPFEGCSAWLKKAGKRVDPN